GAIVAEFTTIGLADINVNWTSWTVVDQGSRVNAIALQYRLGSSGTWIDVDDPVSSIYTGSTTGRGNGVSFSQVLPTDANDQDVVQVRWVYWDFSGSGARDRLAIDDISITGSAASSAEIAIFGNSTEIADGDTTPSTDDD